MYKQFDFKSNINVLMLLSEKRLLKGAGSKLPEGKKGQRSARMSNTYTGRPWEVYIYKRGIREFKQGKKNM